MTSSERNNAFKDTSFDRRVRRGGSSTSEKNGPDLLYAHFFFADIVGLSDPLTSTRRQIKKIETLNEIIRSCEAFRMTDRRSRMILPTGDGLAIGFLHAPELPLKLATELQQRLAQHNKGKATEEAVRIRIGLNDGPVYLVKDIEGNRNIWGPGIILARRVMDIGDDGHILLTPRMAETLRELSDEYRLLIKPLQDYTIKHGQTLLLYSAFGKGIGNPNKPTSSAIQKSRLSAEIIKHRQSTLFKHIEIALHIRDAKSMITHHKRRYHIENLSDEPLNEFLFGIATDVEKTFVGLGIKTHDHLGQELNIISINYDRPYQKEFTVLFRKPIRKGEKRRSFTLEYDVEEPKRYFENYFGVNCDKCTFTLLFPKDAGIKPVMYNVNVERERKTKSRTQPSVTRSEKKGFVCATSTLSSISESEAFRVEW